LPASTERLPLRQISTTGTIAGMAGELLHFADEVRIDFPVRTVVPGDVRWRRRDGRRRKIPFRCGNR
jgi:hypothetical protein